MKNKKTKKLGLVYLLVLSVLAAAGTVLYKKEMVPEYNLFVDFVIERCRDFIGSYRDSADHASSEEINVVTLGSVRTCQFVPSQHSPVSNSDGIVQDGFSDDCYTFTGKSWSYTSPYRLLDRAVLFDDAVVLFTAEPAALVLDNANGKVISQCNDIPQPRSVSRAGLVISILGWNHTIETFEFVAPAPQDSGTPVANDLAPTETVPVDTVQRYAITATTGCMPDGTQLPHEDFMETLIRPSDSVTESIINQVKLFLPAVEQNHNSIAYSVWGGIPFPLYHDFPLTITKISIPTDGSYTVRLIGKEQNPDVYFALFESDGTFLDSNIGYAVGIPSITLPLSGGNDVYAAAGYISAPADAAELLFEVVAP